MTEVDVTIIGGGMVGAALALALPSSLKILLVDAKGPHVQDERLIALNPSSIQLFKQLDLWSGLDSSAASIKKIHVSERGLFGAVRLDANSIGLKALGMVVPANKINGAFNVALQHRANITWLHPALLIDGKLDENPISFSVRQNGAVYSYKSRFLIGADGSQSTVRSLANIKTKTIDYQQSALVTITGLKRDHQNIAYERFVDGGAIAMLPLKGHNVATIWTDSNPVIDHLKQLSESDFLAELQLKFGHRLGRLMKVGPRAFYPLYKIDVDCPVRHHVFLLGNAAHTVHPLAAQGLNIALQEVQLVAEHFKKAGEGALENLGPQLADAFKSQSSIPQNLSHYLLQIFSQRTPLHQFSRQCGMISLDLFSGAKKWFMQKMVGSHWLIEL